jgi:hypothetical protein
MLAKATFRIPKPLMAKLRDQSRQEGRSLNETALRALEKGLGGLAVDEGWLALGSLVEVPPKRPFDVDELRKLKSRLGPGSWGLEEELDWVRGERIE